MSAVGDDLRASPDAMRAEVAARAAAGSWTGTWSDLVEQLLEVGRVDLCLGRLVEGHADARRILAQAGADPQPGTYGVWASRSAGTGLRATSYAGGWRLDGELRFASGVDLVDRALVPGWLDERTHLLLDVAVADVEADRGSWATTAMDASRSFTVRADGLVVDRPPVGPACFYLDRPGFAAGGIGPAAVWVGGVRSVVDQVASGLSRFSPTAHQVRRVGVLEHAAWQAETVLRAVAGRLDAGGAPDEVAAARTTAAEAGAAAVDEAGRVVGPGGLAGDARLARTLADLALSVRQHHVDAVAEQLGTRTLPAGP